MEGEKIILSQIKRKKLKQKVMASIEACPTKLYFIANGRFSHSGSQLLVNQIMWFQLVSVASEPKFSWRISAR